MALSKGLYTNGTMALYSETRLDVRPSRTHNVVVAMTNDEEEDEDDFAIPPSYSSPTVVDDAIRTMEVSQRCLHPLHCHSFQVTHFVRPFQKCALCQQRLPMMIMTMLTSDNTENATVQCAACGIVAHRSCAASRVWTELCPINAAIVFLRDQDTVDDDNQIEEVMEIVAPPTHDEQQQQRDGSTQPPSPLPQQWLAVPSGTSITTIALPESTGDHNDDDDQDEVVVTPLHYANHPFATISRALQENIFAHFQRLEGTTRDSNTAAVSAAAVVNGSSVVDGSIIMVPDDAVATISTDELTSSQQVDTNTNHATNPLVKFASGTMEAVKTLNRKNIGPVAVAGGIAGGLAGWTIAGPAGAYAGCQLGTAGALGVILEGSVSIGVFVASVATGGYTARQVQGHLDERRVLTMGEDGTSRKVLLVRPQIKIDPIWNKIYQEARRSAPQGTGFSFLPNLDAASRQRYRRDSDIVKTDEQEIPTNDKVLLLVSRMLSDKTSVSGHVYRYLVDAFLDRRRTREMVIQTNPSIEAASPRARRDDTHAVIKYVTATLMETRPGFGASPALTELTASAVEGLVFGRLYNLVIEEIVAETTVRDKNLCHKIDAFHGVTMDIISESALESLCMLPQAHSAVDKLYYCVQFLERISTFFSTNQSISGNLCADSLLKLVCQHIISANLAHMNAEVAFLEEFARDDQLLRGKEGYSLVTLQASLHFLNMSDDLETDIFGQDSNEENVPLQQASFDLSEAEFSMMSD